ncbi:MAG: hypothetical protein AAGF74_07205 [Pseudomonadota bacterium]
MTVADELDDIRAEFPECKALAFVDLSSAMALTVSARRKPPQETIDELCQNAIAVLDGPGGEVLVGAAELPPSVRVAHGVLCGQDDLRVFVRSSAVPSEALCGLCGHRLDILAFVVRAARGLSAIEAVQ